MKANRKSKATLILSTFLLTAGISSGAHAQNFWNSSQASVALGDLGDGSHITIGAYNIENFFDTTHDDGHDDYARMPKAWKLAHPDIMRQSCEAMSNYYFKKECYDLDWSEDVLQVKINNIGRAIHSLNKGRGPDILVVEEVENIAVLTRLRDQALSDMGYQTVILINGPDTRGINVGMLSRFPVVDAQLHIVDLNSPTPNPTSISMEEGLRQQWLNSGANSDPFAFTQQIQSGKNTRGILEATFQIGSHQLTVFGNHWPSQGNPVEARLRAAWTLYQAASKAYDLHRDVVALGDFNSTSTDNPNPFTQYLENPNNPLQFIDARDEFIRRYGADRIAPGTEYYKGHWNFLDHFFVLKQSTGAKMENDWQNFSVNVQDFLLMSAHADKTANTQSVGFDLMTDVADGLADSITNSIIPHGMMPFRFDAANKQGYTDHLAITGTMSL